MQVARVDMRERYSAAFVREVNAGLLEYGFIRAVGHGVTPELLLRAQAALQKVVELPSDVLQRSVRRDIHYQRGYAPYGSEGAKDSDEWDLKCFWMTRDPMEPEDPRNNPYGPNIWPEEVPEFRRVMLELFAREYECGIAVLRAIEIGQGLLEGSLVSLTEGAESMLRSIYYPPITDFKTIPAGAVRSRQHEDINLLTVLASSDLRGLELLVRGEWMALHTEPYELVIDTGEMLAEVPGVSGFPAMKHRVVNPEGAAAESARFSFPLFLHALSESVLRGGWSAGALLRKRLSEISPID